MRNKHESTQVSMNVNRDLNSMNQRQPKCDVKERHTQTWSHHPGLPKKTLWLFNALEQTPKPLRSAKALPWSDPCIISYHPPLCSLPPVPLVFLHFLFLPLHVLTCPFLTVFTSLIPFHPLDLTISSPFPQESLLWPPCIQRLFKFLCYIFQRHTFFSFITLASVYIVLIHWSDYLINVYLPH